MKKAVFKTNINCGSCVAKVTPFLDHIKNLESWEVDTTNKDKLLSVKGDEVDTEQVKRLVKEAGFEITPKKSGLRGLFG